MLPAFLTDTRIEYAQRKIIRAQDSRIESLETMAAAFKQQVECQRHRAERAEANLAHLRSERSERDVELATRLRCLEIAAGITPPDASDDATEN